MLAIRIGVVLNSVSENAYELPNAPLNKTLIAANGFTPVIEMVRPLNKSAINIAKNELIAWILPLL
ncbi:MAG TPA: hypothetical protein PLD11_06955 [Flexilinea sp.]|jgi:hypothetical protein|nr:hypothetical protein [Flexilinea sp.]